MAALAELEITPGAVVQERLKQRRGRALLVHAAAVLLFTTLTLTRALQLVCHPASTVAPDSIDPVFNIWAIATANHNVSVWPEGLWSLFHANIFYPTPHAASYGDVFIGLLPFSFPLHLLIGNPVVLTNVLLALSFILSAYGTFLLGYELTGSYAAALVAGLVFGFCPLRTEHVGHLTVLSTQWMVVAAYCLALAWRYHRRRWWALAGISLGLTAISNLYYLAYLSLPLIISVCLLWRSWTRERIANAAIAVAIFLALTAPVIAPYLTRHAAMDEHYGSAGSIDLLSFLHVWAGQPIDSWLLPNVSVQMMQPNHAFFPGFMVAALALVALRHRRARLWTVFALSCAILALGEHLNVGGHIAPIPLPYALLENLIPHFRVFRAPDQATIGLFLGLAVLAAWGTRDVLAQLSAAKGRHALVSAAIVGIVALSSWAPVPTTTLAAIPAGEHWLVSQTRIHTIVELPIRDDNPLDWQRQTEIMYDSTAHWKALVNGSASVDPVGMAQRRAVLSTYPSPASLALLRRLHVDAVVLRLPWLAPAQRAAAQRVCHMAYRDSVEEICLTS